MDTTTISAAAPGCESAAQIQSPTSCCGSQPAAESFHARLGEMLQRHDVNEYAASVKVFAVKP